MGTRRGGFPVLGSGGNGFPRGSAGALKERANMSFMLVVMFFAVFGLIVLTEIFLIDERRSNSGNGALGGHRQGPGRLAAAPDRPDYDDVAVEDYIGLKGGFDAQVGLLMNDDKKKKTPPISADQRDIKYITPNLELQFPQFDENLRETSAEWLPVTNTRFKFFVYSAYYDDRIVAGSSSSSKYHTQVQKKSQGLIRVIGATKTRAPDRVWCRLWYNENTNIKNSTFSITVPAKIKAIRENWNLKYSACFVICPLPEEFSNTIDNDNKLIPESVSIVSRLKVPPKNRLKIQNRPSERNEKRQSLGVCVKPLHYDYNRILQLIEFIELHKILGAVHITMYNDTVGSEANCVLKYYEDKGDVSILPWHKLDMISQREIRTEGLFAALNDCLYRSMYKYEFVALLDLDEFIIPRHNDTIIDLIQWMSSKMSTKSGGSFSFQNAFFYLQWPDDPWVTTSKTQTEAGLITLRKTRRKTKLHPHKQRSKYICTPRDVVEAGNHFVWEFLPGHGTLNVIADHAILHHYRVCEFGGNDCIKTSSVIDRTAYKYRDKLSNTVNDIWNEIDGVCKLPKLEPVPVLSSLVPSSPDQIPTR